VDAEVRIFWDDLGEKEESQTTVRVKLEKRKKRKTPIRGGGGGIIFNSIGKLPGRELGGLD